jgi:hypothetical protein
MPYCRACGAAVDADENFCTACGESIEDPSDEPPEGVGADAAGSDDAGGSAPATGTAAADTEPRTDPTTEETRGRQIAFVGAAISAAAAFLPWATAETAMRSQEVTGIDGDGVVTLGLAVVAVLVLLVGLRKPWSVPSRVAVCILGVLIALVGLYYISGPGAISTIDTPRGVEVSVDVGLYLTALGGAALALGPLYPLRSKLG